MFQGEAEQVSMGVLRKMDHFLLLGKRVKLWPPLSSIGALKMRSFYSILVALTTLGVTAIAVATSHSTSARSGEAVFAANCANCHTGGIGGFFSGGPDIEDPEDLKALSSKGLDALTENTIAGVGEMAARGGCDECTDEEIRNAIEYMLGNIQ